MRPVLPLRPARAEEYLNFGTVIQNAGRWLTDEHGRVVVLHGVNMVNKLPPYDPAAIGFGVDDARFLGAEGFNTVRLGIVWKAVEP